MPEDSKWEPQGIPEPPRDSPPRPVTFGSVPPAVPNGNKNNSLPWFLWVFAGCGCLALFLIPIILVFVFVASNKFTNFEDIGNSYYMEEVETTANAIKKCIEVEKGRETITEKIYSNDTCANKDYLYDSHYLTVTPLSDLRILTNPLKTKICVYITFYGGQEEDLVTSWNTEEGMSESGKGTKECSNEKSSKTKTATNSASPSAN